jgi:nitrile hydratase subunit alpha
MSHADGSQGGSAAHSHGTVSKDHDDRLSYFRAMEIALRELLIAKAIFTADDVRGAVEAMDSRTPENGARLVARAWTDPPFKARLLADGSAAARESGFEVGTLKLMVIENTPEVHNLVVCTLCSCYPRMLIGLPPAWYKSAAYRRRAVREPRAVLREFGTIIPDTVEVRVHDSTADLRYLILPMRPAGTEGWGEEQLVALVSRDSLIGVTVPVAPVSSISPGEGGIPKKHNSQE